MKNKALGLIEVVGFLAAIEAADVALKSANVHLLNVEKVQGGLVSVSFTGDVGAVKASVDAAAVSASKLGRIHSAHVIPRPDSSIWDMITNNAIKKIKEDKNNNDLDISVIEKTVTKAKDIKNINLDINVIEKVATKTATKTEDNVDINSIDLEKLSVIELRNLARKLQIKSIKRSEIKFAKRDELLSKLKQHILGGDN
ncbi:MAG: BMC domain-containing protein [Oscillospiraceae bacterium]